MPTPLPIVSLGNLLSFLISFGIALRLWYSWRRSGGLELRNFFLVFASLTAFFFFSATPGLLSKDPFLLGLTNVATFPFAHLGAFFFALVPLTLLRLERLKQAYTVLFVIVLAFSFGLRVLGFGPLREVQKGDFVFWLRPDNPLMEISFLISGVLLFTSVAIAGFVFLLYGLRNKENRYVFIRSLILGTGTMLLGVVAALNFLVGANPNPGAQLSSSLLAAFSLVYLAFGIYYRRRIEV